MEYFEGVLKIVGAGGLPLTMTFKRKFKSISKESDPAEGTAPTDAAATSALDSDPADGAKDGAADGAAADADTDADADADAGRSAGRSAGSSAGPYEEGQRPMNKLVSA